MAQPIDVMVLCAGLGTRLRPLTLERPKPAVPLMNRPLCGYTFALARSGGASRIVINTHWLPEVMNAFAQEEAATQGLGLASSHEPEILGTGGGLWQARERGLLRRDHHVVVLNGDVLSDTDLRAVIQTHMETRAAATMVLRPMPSDGGYTPIETDAKGHIVRIGQHGKSIGATGHLFTGAHVLSPEALDLLPPGESSVVTTVYAALLARGARVQAAFEQGLWLDLGDPQGYLEAHLRFVRGQIPVAALQRFGLAGSPAPVDPGARVGADVVTEESVVGAGAVIGAGAVLRQCVIWPGANVVAGTRLERAIVTPKSIVQVS